MNPVVVKVGIGIVVSVAAYLFTVWRFQRNAQQLQHKYENPGNYDGSNISICCICLSELKLFKKNEVISLPCRHKICRMCAKLMFSSQVRNARNCPHCRQLVPEEFVSLIL